MGSASAVMALVLPPILVRSLDKVVFGTWELVLQVGAYTAFLNFGIEVAVGRFVAYHTEQSQYEERNRVVSTAFAMLIVMALIGLLMVAILVALLPMMFHGMPASLVKEARIALALVGGALALRLPFNATNAVFIGLQQNRVPANITVISKVVLTIGLAVVAGLVHDLLSLAVVFSVTSVLTYLWQWNVFKRKAGFVEISKKFVSRKDVRSVASYCVSLTIWSVAMLMVSGLDTTIVGIFDYGSVAYYAVAASLVGFMIGFQNAVFSTLIPAGAAFAAKSTPEQVGQVLIRTSKYGTLILLATGIPVLLTARPILTFWVGKSYADAGTAILQILVFANIMRWTAGPYAMLLVATEKQRYVVVTPLIEGFTNLVFSVLLAWRFGVIGVAVGTLIGSFTGVLGNYTYNMNRTQDAIRFKLSDYYLQALWKPAACCLPLIIPLYFYLYDDVGSGWQAVLWVFSGVAGIAVMWGYALDDHEKHVVLSAMRTRS